MRENQKMVEDLRGGRENLFNYFFGRIMRQTKGRANPEIVSEILRKRLLNG